MELLLLFCVICLTVSYLLYLKSYVIIIVFHVKSVNFELPNTINKQNGKTIITEKICMQFLHSCWMPYASIFLCLICQVIRWGRDSTLTETHNPQWFSSHACIRAFLCRTGDRLCTFGKLFKLRYCGR